MSQKSAKVKSNDKVNRSNQADAIPLSKVRPLCNLSTIFGLLVPNVLNYTGLSVWYIFYVLVMFIFKISIFIYQMTLQFKYTYPYTLSTILVIDFTLNFILHITTLTSIGGAVFKNRKDFVKFFRILREFDEYFSNRFGNYDVEVVRNFNLELFLVHFLLLAYYIYAYLTNICKASYFTVIICTSNFICIYYLAIVVLQIYYFTRILQYRFKVVNSKLADIIKDYLAFKKYEKSIPSVTMLQTSTHLLDVSKNHEKLCELVDIINKIYGIQITFIFALSIVAVIESVNFGLKLSFKILNINDVDMIENVILIFWTTAIFLMFLIMVVMICDETSKEAQKIVQIGTKFLLEVPACPDTVNDQIIHNQLIQLNEHIAFRKPEFSGGGFFTVNYGTLFLAFGCMTSYIVICLQFK